MIIQKKVIEKIGCFDTSLGPGTKYVSEDCDIIFRASESGFTGKHIPKLIIYHNHNVRGYKQLMQRLIPYARGSGAFHMKHILKGKQKILSYWLKKLKEQDYGLTMVEIKGALDYYNEKYNFEH